MLTISEFKKSIEIDTRGVEERARTALEKLRVSRECDPDAAFMMLDLARLSLLIRDFPRRIRLVNESNRFNEGLEFRCDTDALTGKSVWRLHGDETALYRAAGIGGGSSSIINHALRAMGVPHSAEAHNKLKSVIGWDLRALPTQIRETCDYLAPHVKIALLGHGGAKAALHTGLYGEKHPVHEVQRAWVNGLMGPDGTGADPNAIAGNAGCALNMAAQYANDDYVFLLIAHGALPDGMMGHERPITTAVRYLRDKVVKALAFKGASLNFSDEAQENLLHLVVRSALRSPYCATRVAEVLIEAGAGALTGQKNYLGLAPVDLLNSELMAAEQRNDDLSDADREILERLELLIDDRSEEPDCGP